MIIIQNKTICWINLCYKLDLYQWLIQITQSLRMQEMWIWVGFSFLMKKNSPEGDTIIYCYAARELSIEKTKLYKREQLDEFCDLFKQTSEFEILSAVFAAKDHNPFKQSGFYPYKLIGCHVCIR